MPVGSFRNFFLIGTAACLLSGIYYSAAALFSIKKFVIVYDPALSEQARSQIKQIVKDTGTRFKKCVYQIKEACPAINTVSFLQEAQGVCTVRMSCHKPLVRINGQALLKDGHVCSTQLYQESIVESVPAITYAQSAQRISPAFKEWLLHLEKSFYDTYAIVWHHDYEIHLTHKHCKKQIIICSVASRLTSALVDTCQHEIEKKMKTAQGTELFSTVTADIRFEEQIIIHALKGGASNGTAIYR